MNKHYFKGVLFISLAALFWSSAGLLIKWTSLEALPVAMYRSLWAGLFLWLYFLIIKRNHPATVSYHISRKAIGTAIFYMLTVTLFVTANKMTTAANAVFLQYTAPVYVILITYVFLKEKVYPAEVITVMVCLAGMGLFFLDSEKSTAVWGNLIGMVSGMVFALLQIFVKRTEVHQGQLRENDPDYLNTKNIQSAYHLALGNGLTVIMTSIILAGIGFYHAERASSPLQSVLQEFYFTSGDFFIVLVLGVFQLGMGYVCFAKGVQYLSNVEISIYTLLEPICNPVWAYIGIGEEPGFWAMGGGTLILCALLLNAAFNIKRQGIS